MASFNRHIREKNIAPVFNIYISLILCVFFATTYTAYPESINRNQTLKQYVHEIWGQKDGLDSPSIWSITQTKDGYLWLGTFNGLIQFDGIKFTIFNRSNTEALKNNKIADIQKDPVKGLWILTADNILLKYENGQFNRYSPPIDPVLTKMRCLHIDKSGKLWIGCTHGVITFKNNSFKKTTLPGLKQEVISISSNKKGEVWMATNGNGLYYSYRNSVTPFSRTANTYLSDLSKVKCDKNGFIWLLTESGKIYKKEGDNFSFITKAGDERVLYCDSNGDIWFNNEGISRIGKHGIENFRVRDGLSDNRVRSVYEDRTGNIWVGTYSGGLNQFKTSSIEVLSIENSSFLWGLHEDSAGALWGASDKGIIYKIDNSSAKRYLDLPERLRSAGINREINIIYTIYHSPETGFWLGTNSGLVSINRKGKIKLYEKLNGIRINVIYELPSRPGELIIATRLNGAYIVKNGELTHLPLKQTSLSIYSAAEDHLNSNILWLGTGNGLIKYNLKNSTHESIVNRKSITRINYITFDSEGTIWLATSGNGLSRYKNGIFENITTDKGLPDDIIFSVKPDSRNNLWMSCDRGLFYIKRSDAEAWFEGKTEKVYSTIFRESDGLKSAEFVGAQNSVVTRKRSRFFVYSTLKGVVMIDPLKNVKPSSEFPVYIRKLMINRKPVSPDSEILSTPDTGHIEFHYTALDYKNPGSIRFRYRLEGYDSEWINAGTRRIAYYTNIPPGNYTFHVSASNRPGIWNKREDKLSFTIKPLFYETWWFISLATLIALYLVYLVFQLLLNAEKKRNLLLKQEIGKRKKVQAALQNSENLLNSFYDNTPSILFIKSTDGKYLMINRRFEEFFKLNKEEVIGKTDRELFPPETADSFIQHDLQAIYGKDHLEYEEEIGINGRFFTYLSVKFPVFDVDDKIMAVCGISNDISASKQATRELKKYQVDLEELVKERTRALEDLQQEALHNAHKAGMAEIVTDVLHNIGNVLTNVKTSSHTIEIALRSSSIKNLKKGADLLEENMENIEEFLQSSKGIKLLKYLIISIKHIEDEFGVIEENRKRLHNKINTISEVITAQQTNAATNYAMKEKADLRTIIEDALRLDIIPLKSLGNKIKKQFDPVPEVVIQKSKLIQIIINLIKNASEAMSSLPVNRRSLSISLDSNNHNVFLRITDNGKGIEKELLKKIFHHGYTTRKDGHGFGLHSCATYMSDMGGDIYAESEGINRGATFILKFRKEM